MRKAVQVAAVIVGLALAAVTQAAEPRLGTIESRSQSGEPVSARIPLHDVEADQLAQFEVELAPSRVFARAGLQRQEELSSLSFAIVTEGEAAPYIDVTSDEPIELPLLDFLVRLSWPQGELTREYTLLLDEPTTVAEARERREKARREEEQRQADAELETAEQEAASETSKPSAYGPVERGDTLWSIAEQYRPDDSVTIAQTMLAIQRLNPQAFADDNVNDLLSGFQLQLPDKEEIQKISAAQAQSTYEDHLAAWVSPAERRPQEAQEGPRMPIPEVDEPVPQVAEREARLRVVALDETSSDQVLALLDADLEPSEANLKRLQGAVVAMREERASLRAERENLQDRVGDLSERVEALERLLNMRMADVLPPPQEPTPRAPLPKVGMLEEDLPRPESASKPEPEPTPEPKQRLEELKEEAGEAPWWASLLADVEELDVAPGDITAAHLWQEDTLRQRALIALGVTLLTISVVAGVIAYRRRKQMESRQSAKKRFDPADFGLDAEQEQRPARRDPLDLAEDYIADDELDNARQVLERGLHSEPHRADLRLKLLDVLANLNDYNAFMDQAQELYDRTRSDADPVWQTALNIGRRFAPDSPLFGGLAAGAAVGAETAAAGPYGATDQDQSDDDDLDAKPDLEALDLGFDENQEDDQSDSEDDFERRLDQAFDADQGQEPEPESAMQQDPEQSAAAQDAADDLFGQADEDEDSGYSELEEMDIDGLLSEEGFDDDSGTDEQTAAGDERSDSTAEQPATEGDSGAELDELMESAQQQSAAEPAEPSPAAGSESADDDLLAGEAGTDSEQDELELGPGEGDQSDTMLDLARAYIDLGDEASAREMLEEVIENGTESQRDSAREVLSQLGS